MATNPYITRGYRPEQSLYEDIVIESLQFYGQDVYYLPREIIEQDRIFGDEIESRFTEAYKIEMYIENIEGFDGQGDLFTKFGVEIRDQATFIVARKRWKNLIGAYLEEKNFRPREGDIIFLPMSQSMFEIMKVETETPFYQLQNLPTFRMQCELFEYDDEKFDTLVDEIDQVVLEGAYKYNLQMLTSDSATARGTLTTNNNGQVTAVSLDFEGHGYNSVPTISVSDATIPVEVARFGNSSLNFLLYRDINRLYDRTGNGSIEFFYYPTSLPDSENYFGLLISGSDSDEKKFIIGTDYAGNLAFGNFTNDSAGTLTTTSALTSSGVITTQGWNHVLIGNDGPLRYAFINGERVLYDSAADSANFIDNKWYLGLGAIGSFGNVLWDLPSGYIDEFRAKVGDYNGIISPRLQDATTLTIPTVAFESDGSTAALEHFTARKPTFTLTVDETLGVVTAIQIEDSGYLYPDTPDLEIASPFATLKYIEGETVVQDLDSFSISGIVAAWSDSDYILRLYNVGSSNGKKIDFRTEIAAVGQTSGAKFAPKAVSEDQDIQKSAQNRVFDDFEGDFLDFSESNPFGDMQ